jgi:hypothetical protein
MICVVCSRRIEEGHRHGQPPREAQYCLKCRAERRRRAKVKYTWRPEFDAFLKAQYFGGLNRRFQVLNRMVRVTGLPRWYIKKQAARLGLTMKMDRKPWTSAELMLVERLVGRVSAATITKRLHRAESSVVNKLRHIGTSRRVGEGYALRDLELCSVKTTTRLRDGSAMAGFVTGGKARSGAAGTTTTFIASARRTFCNSSRIILRRSI